ncbi:histidine phosphatase family protein [Brochothrix campestris]|uniref:Phosphoglycerate mutase family protein n=1 Tax=Brochothrix campestris FSL F6-1037 TaxID=1265861 RepID=W7CQL4_9LIST|nr:histidine phosphatase family protein [Brochothrix campestris]EUJ41919.1 phosphoglycerate mutase family protein [Brochothrix campestris FSL F6-1037]
MMKIVFVRHAQKERQSYVKDKELPLTAAGLASSLALVRQLEGYQFDRAFSSPFKRAKDTIAPLVVANDLALTECEDLQERRVKAEGVIKPADYVARQWADFDYKLTGGESLAEVQARLIAKINAFALAYPQQTLLIGTHGTALATILNYYDASFGLADYLQLKPLMPYVLEARFEGTTLVGMKVITIE